VLAELREFLDIIGLPLARTVRYHEPAIPKYSVGHSELVDRIEEAVSCIPGLALAGNAYHGMGLPDCVASAYAAADRIINARACDNLRSELTVS
jgi:oxygen-dependent protoporphyrinogen oxidase